LETINSNTNPYVKTFRKNENVFVFVGGSNLQGWQKPPKNHFEKPLGVLTPSKLCHVETVLLCKQKKYCAEFATVEVLATWNTGTLVGLLLASNSYYGGSSRNRI
jgi:hypothetical protein